MAESIRLLESRLAESNKENLSLRESFNAEKATNTRLSAGFCMQTSNNWLKRRHVGTNRIRLNHKCCSQKHSRNEDMKWHGWPTGAELEETNALMSQYSNQTADSTSSIKQLQVCLPCAGFDQHHKTTDQIISGLSRTASLDLRANADAKKRSCNTCRKAFSRAMARFKASRYRFCSFLMNR